MIGRRYPHEAWEEWHPHALYARLWDQSLYTGLLLLAVAIWVMAYPDIPASGQDLLLVTFACLALLPQARLKKNPPENC